MANPKRRHSNTRTRLRRSHDFLEIQSASKCTQCGALILPHRVCPKCGYYKGRLVLAPKAKKEKKKA